MFQYLKYECSRVSKFREDLQEMRTRFEGLKKQQQAQQLEQNRDSLFARRGRHQTTTESSSVSEQRDQTSIELTNVIVSGISLSFPIRICHARIRFC